MESRFERQLKKGVLEMVVLGLICRRPAYGYELLQRLQKESDGLLCLKEGTLYPILYRLEDEGLICSSWSAPDTAARTVPKKTYTATEAGRAALLAEQAAWQRLCGCVEGFVARTAADENAETEVSK